MNRKTLFLLVFPVLLIITAVVLNHARGPFWQATNHDPEYVYLLNASNMASFQRVGHIDHPGTTVQLIGALTLRVVHFFKCSSGIDLHTDVVARSEYYLTAINMVFVGLNALILFFLGFVAYSLSRSLWMGLWLQLAPFFSITFINSGLTRVSPEPLLFFSSLFMVLLLLHYLFRPSSSYKTIIRFALLLGFGIASKVTFLPLLVIPVILFPGFKKKLISVLTAIVGFVIFTLPIIGMYDQFFDWLFKLVSHKQSYGTGEKGVISFPVYLENIKGLLTDNPFFSLTLAAVIGSLIILIVFPRLRTALKGNNRFKLLISIAIVQVAGVLMVAKHPASHYLVPVLGLSGFGLVLLLEIFKQVFPLPASDRTAGTGGLKKNYPVYISIALIGVLVILFNPVTGIWDVVKQKSTIKSSSLALYRLMNTSYHGWAKVYYYPSSAPAFALKFGNDMSCNTHVRDMNRMYTNIFFYDIIRKDFYSFDYSQQVPFGVIQAKYGDKIVFQGGRSVKIPGLELKQVLKGGLNEVISIIDPKSSAVVRNAINWLKENIPAGSYLVLPKEFGSGLQVMQRDYKVVTGDYRHFDTRHFYLLSQFLGDPYFCVPAPGFYGKGAVPKGVGRNLRAFVQAMDVKALLPDEQKPDFYVGSLSNASKLLGGAIPVFKEIPVWFPNKKLDRNISPSLYIIGKKGKFDLRFPMEEGVRVLRITNSEADKEGKRFCRFGFRMNKNGFKPQFPRKTVVHFLVTVRIAPESSHLINKNNFIYIQSVNGKWERDKVYFSGTGWITYLISKTVQPNVTDLQLGFQFVPNSAEDQLLVKDIKVFLE